MADLHLLTGAYALHALDDVERAAAERHLASCGDCAHEVGEFREATAFLAARVATPPPAELRARVLARVHETRQLPPMSTQRSLPRFSARRALAVAATAVVVAGGSALGGVAWNANQDADQARQQAAAISSVLTDPGREQRDGTISVGGSATVVAAGDRAVFAASDLPAPPDGRTYQLWVIGGGDPGRIRSAGLLDLSAGTTQALVEGVGAGDQIAVSVEPEGGSQQPTTTPVVAVPVA